jgi:8-amino-7-oxononanoate synthase
VIGPDPLTRLRERAAARRAAGLRRVLRPRPPGGGGLVDLAGNDYLGLATDPRVVEAAAQAARTWGVGATGSRLVTGSTALHADLEGALSDFIGVGAALVFSSGYLANLGVLTALADASTLVVSDALNHASLIDGCRLAAARVEIVGHADVAAVERALADRAEPHGVVVTDAVFSVDGDLAPLADLHAVARQHGALLLVDEAHALGTVGPGGRGAAHTAGLAGEPDVVLTVTLSKALGSQGGAVLGHPEVIDHLVDTARAFIFDTGLAPPAAGGALEALGIIAAEPERVAAARSRAREIATLAHGAGLASGVPDAAVVSARIGSPVAAVEAAATCARHGVRVGCFRPPSVPDGVSRLRMTGRATLTAPDLARLSRALEAVRADLETGAGVA